MHPNSHNQAQSLQVHHFSQNTTNHANSMQSSANNAYAVSPSSGWQEFRTNHDKNYDLRYNGNGKNEINSQPQSHFEQSQQLSKVYKYQNTAMSPNHDRTEKEILQNLVDEINNNRSKVSGKSYPSSSNLQALSPPDNGAVGSSSSNAVLIGDCSNM